MGNLTTKYDMGDKVFKPYIDFIAVSTECPDCVGTKKVWLKFPIQPDGSWREDEEINCPTCGAGVYSSGKVQHEEYVPFATEVTIGQVGYENGMGKYMCHETGIGSGQVYTDENIYDTKEEALVKARFMVEKQNAVIAKNNFDKKGVLHKFSQALQNIGYRRADAIRKELELKNWIQRVKNSKL